VDVTLSRQLRVCVSNTKLIGKSLCSVGNVTCGQTDGRTDGRTGRQTDRQTDCAGRFSALNDESWGQTVWSRRALESAVKRGSRAASVITCYILCGCCASLSVSPVNEVCNWIQLPRPTRTCAMFIRVPYNTETELPLHPIRVNLSRTDVRFIDTVSYVAFLTLLTMVYPEVSGLAAWSENCKWYRSLTLGAVVSLFCESV
jgi:hypothetical protein